MLTPMNPLVPTTYDVIMSLIFIASAILTISVIILIARSEASSTAKAMAGLAVIIFPIIGPVAYLARKHPFFQLGDKHISHPANTKPPAIQLGVIGGGGGI